MSEAPLRATRCGASSVLRNVLKSNTRAGPALTRQRGVRFLDRSLNLIGKLVRPELWLRPHHIRARQSRATKFASAPRTCLRTVPGVCVGRPRIGAASRRIPQGERYFAARSAWQNIAHARGRAGRQHRFGVGRIRLPAHLQIRKLFSKKCLHSSRIIGYYLPR